MKEKHMDYVIYICFAAMGVVILSASISFAKHNSIISAIFLVLGILMILLTIKFIIANEKRTKNKA